MKGVNSYPSVYALGHAAIKELFFDVVLVEEKIDGSQFRFGITEEGKLMIGSKNTIIQHPDENKMFKPGTEYILSVEKKIRAIILFFKLIFAFCLYMAQYTFLT